MRWRIAAVVAIALVLGIYALNRSWLFLRGPRIVWETTPENAVVKRAAVHVAGKAAQVAELRIAGRVVFLQEDGGFDETLLLAPGPSTIEIRGRDKFGRIIVLRRAVVYAPES